MDLSLPNAGVTVHLHPTNHRFPRLEDPLPDARPKLVTLNFPDTLSDFSFGRSFPIPFVTLQSLHTPRNPSHLVHLDVHD